MSEAPPPGEAALHHDDDAACWQAAKQIRQEHPNWVVIWIARIGQFRAYPNVRSAARDRAHRPGTRGTSRSDGTDRAGGLHGAGQVTAGRQRLAEPGRAGRLPLRSPASS
jgi:hypothetical protein